jgi:putative endonuclease
VTPATLDKIKKLKGAFWENYVCLRYFLCGYRILAMRKRNSYAEIDILAYKKRTLVLIEVKYRKTEASAVTALSYAQKLRLRKALQAEASRRKFIGNLRCDYVAVFGYGKIQRFENAF